MKIVFCIPTIKKPYQATLDALANSIPLLNEHDIEHYMVNEVNCPYISAARATMLRKALDIKPDAIVFIDHDVSWRPEDLLKLIQTEGDVVAGTYRFKKDEIEYMGALLPNIQGLPQTRKDGALKAHSIPAGFLKITAEGVSKFMQEYPELTWGPYYARSVDLFNHGVIDNVWYGEDYAFSKRWREKCGDIWIVPDMDINHHTEGAVYAGNYHQFLLRQPGGSHEGKPYDSAD